MRARNRLTLLFVEILIVVVLTLLNGALAMSELAVVSSRPARLKVLAAEGNKGADAALKLAPSDFDTIVTRAAVLASEPGRSPERQRVVEHPGPDLREGDLGHSPGIYRTALSVRTRARARKREQRRAQGKEASRGSAA